MEVKQLLFPCVGDRCGKRPGGQVPGGGRVAVLLPRRRACRFEPRSFGRSNGHPQ